MVGSLSLIFFLQVADPSLVLNEAYAARAQDALGTFEAEWSSVLSTDPSDRLARLGLGAAASARYAYDDALEHFRTAVETGDDELDRLSAYALFAAGSTAALAGRWTEALEPLESAVRIGEALQDSALVTRTLSVQAGVAIRTRGFADARQLIDRAAEWTSPGRPEYPQYLCNRSGLDGTVSVDALQDAADHASEIGQPHVAGRCLFQAMARLAQRGVSDSVARLGEAAIERQSAARDRSGLATTRQWLGFYQRSLGTYGLAEETLRAAVRDAEATGNGPAEAWAWLNLAVIAQGLGDAVGGLEHAERAERLLRAQGDLVGLAEVEGVRGGLWMLMGQYDQARAAFGRARTTGEELGSAPTVLGNVYAIANTALEEGDFPEAEARVAEYLELVDEYGARGFRPGGVQRLADVALALGQWERADSLYHSVQPLERTSVREAQLLTTMSAARARLHDLDSAVVLAETAADIMDRWRGETSDARLRLTALQREGGDVGLATVVNALAEAGRVDVAFSLGERRRSRELVAQITREDAMAGRPSRVRGTVVPPLAELRDSIPAGVAVLVLTTARLEPTTSWLITRDEIAVETLQPIDRSRDAVDRFVTLNEQGQVADAAAQEVAEAVLPRSLETLPASIRHLVFVGEDALLRVPLGVLPLGEGHVMDRFAVTYAPSATYAHGAWPSNVAMTDDAPLAVLAIGDPEAGGRSVEAVGLRTDSLGALPGARSEARAVGRYGVESETWLGRAATEAALKDPEVSRFGVIHLATHAIVDRQSSARTAVVLSADGAEEDGFLRASEISELTLQARLVVLSSCTSGDGVFIRGEGLHGLTGPFLRGGADAVLATMWRVDDDAVTPFVERIYAKLAEGGTAAEALRRAQVEARDAGTPQSVWAAFTLHGSGLTPVPLETPRRWAWVGLLTALLAVAFALAARARSATKVVAS